MSPPPPGHAQYNPTDLSSSVPSMHMLCCSVMRFLQLSVMDPHRKLPKLQGIESRTVSPESTPSTGCTAQLPPTSQQLSQPYKNFFSLVVSLHAGVTSSSPLLPPSGGRGKCRNVICRQGWVTFGSVLQGQDTLDRQVRTCTSGLFSSLAAGGSSRAKKENLFPF